MKKIYYSLGIMTLALFIAIPAVTYSAPKADKVKEKVQEVVQNAGTNKNIRNQQQLSTSTASSTATSTETAKNRGQENKALKAKNDLATSSKIRSTKNLQKVEKNVFEVQKAHLVAQLNKALSNLEQVRGRIANRIQKAEASGRNMANAKALLVTADTKIVAARNAINAFAGVSVTTSVVNSTTTATTTVSGTTSTSQTSTSTVIVELSKPRQVGAGAIQAIQDAKKALVEVVIAIAHSMGLKVGQDGTISSSTPTTTSPTNTGTTTATSTQNTSTTTATTTQSTGTTTTSTATTSASTGTSSVTTTI